MSNRKVLLALTFALTLGLSAHCQVVINEVYINAVINDGSPAPNTGEWVEFYNTSASSVDMSCWVFCDGDFCVTIPDGTILLTGDFFLVGSAAGAGCGVGVDGVVGGGDDCDFSFTPNLDWATCGCTAGIGVGVLTNNGEQIVLYDDNGTVIDAVYWSGGQNLPDIGNISATVGVCASQTLSLPITSDAIYENIGSGGGNGQSKARTTNGGSTWSNESNPSAGGSNEPLPITLRSFEAFSDYNLVRLTWTTSSELNNDYFTIERSMDGSLFAPLLTIPGAGSSTTAIEYETIDQNPIFGYSYYRLKQTDFDGTSAIFDIAFVDRSAYGKISIYPQPATQYDDLVISFPGNEKQSVLLQLYDTYGKQVFIEKITNVQRYNKLRIPLQMNSGIYIVKISSSGFNLSEQLIVMK